MLNTILNLLPITLYRLLVGASKMVSSSGSSGIAGGMHGAKMVCLES